jgi:hypothetical protein
MLALRASFCLLLIIGLMGCDPWSEPESMMDEYLTRLSRVLDVEAGETQNPVVPLLPRPRERRAEIPEMDINMLDFLSLYGCELQVVVGERNSIMGRVMTPLNQLRYQQRFIRTAQTCLPKIDEPDLKATLKKAIRHKREVLPAYLWNAIWADEPMAELMTRSKGRFTVESNASQVNQLLQDLDHVSQMTSQILSGNSLTSVSAMVDIHQRWVFNHQPGQLINSARLLIGRLNAGTSMIQQRLKARPLCYQGKQNKQSRRVEGMFKHVYIDRVQPYIASVSQSEEKIFSRLASLAELQQSVMPAGFKPYYQKVINAENKNSLWQRLDSAVSQHTKAWQQLLSQCELQPRAD